MEIRICSCGSCFYSNLNIHELENFTIKKCGCLGFCGFGPVAIIDSKVIPINNKIIKEISKDTKYIETINGLKFKKENKILMRDNNILDPEDFEEYLKLDGMKGFEKAISIGQEQVIEEIKKSGLRGRGGAAFPTFKKLQMVKEQTETPKFVVANLEEGEVASFNNTILAESNPFSIIEGTLIAAFAVGAQKAYIFVNAKAKLAIKRLQNAINKIKEYLKNINFSFDIEIRRSPSAYIAGEETAMLEVIEGKKAYPRNKPPFPVSVGLFGKPTLINNVETLAAMAYILKNGSEFYTSFGEENSYGTKMISLTGNVNNPCVNEVPFSITIKETVEEIGMGYKEENKGFLIGGPSGGIVSISENTKYTYDEIAKTGAMIGSGGIYCISKNTNIVELSKYLMKFFQDESCGQCIPCRVGTKKLTEILENLLNGNELPKNIDEINDFIMNVSLCGLGQAAPIPLITAMKYFPNEFKTKELV
jgi:NADH:ubiquinone oxidoreductase subunit F (NADH-binding)